MVSARSYLCDGSRRVSAGLTAPPPRACRSLRDRPTCTRQARGFSPRLVEEQALHGCAIGKRPTGLVHHPSHAVEELHHDPAHSEARAVGSAGLCGTGAFTGSSRPAGHIWANVFSLVRRSSQSSCVLSNWDTPKASPIALPRGSTVSGLQSAPMRGRLRLWSIVRWRPGTGSRQAAAPVRTRRILATRICRGTRRTGGKGRNGIYAAAE